MRLLLAALLVVLLAGCEFKCVDCGGSGRADCTQCAFGKTSCNMCAGGMQSGTACKFCHGTGDRNCLTCKGQGDRVCYSCGGDGK